ncbi:MAG TPA: hypothetical protein VL996_00840 [Methylocella sp.]|nr:hypothetical protein [Methylocella sp.]
MVFALGAAQQVEGNEAVDFGKPRIPREPHILEGFALILDDFETVHSDEHLGFLRSKVLPRERPFYSKCDRSGTGGVTLGE